MHRAKQPHEHPRPGRKWCHARRAPIGEIDVNALVLTQSRPNIRVDVSPADLPKALDKCHVPQCEVILQEIPCDRDISVAGARKIPNRRRTDDHDVMSGSLRIIPVNYATVAISRHKAVGHEKPGIELQNRGVMRTPLKNEWLILFPR